jgi:hypothetical protein
MIVAGVWGQRQSGRIFATWASSRISPGFTCIIEHSLSQVLGPGIPASDQPGGSCGQSEAVGDPEM